MANYSIAAGKRAVHDKTLVASTADTVTINVEPEDQVEVEVLSDGTAAIYVAWEGVAAVSGDNTLKLPGGTGPNTLPFTAKAGQAGTIIVSIVSAGTPTYSVMRT